jgi:putative ATP-dependent endonuclease of the OLD family
LSNIIRVNLNQKNVAFIPLRGIRNLSHYAAREILDFLSNRKVKMWFIIDRDEKAVEDIAQIRDRLGTSVAFFQTVGRELENYLLSPRANLSYLNTRFKPGQMAALPTEDDVREKLNLCADTLKCYVRWKRVSSSVGPLYPVKPRKMRDTMDRTAEDLTREDINNSIAELNSALSSLEDRAIGIEKDLNENWEVDKLKLVPGALLLDEFYKTYKFRFEKMRDAPLLASHMTASEIDATLAALIREIGSDI